jgi:hypothetical protein
MVDKWDIQKSDNLNNVNIVDRIKSNLHMGVHLWFIMIKKVMILQFS